MRNARDASPDSPSGDQPSRPMDRPLVPSIVAASGEKNSPRLWLVAHAWLIYVLPLVVFMLVGVLEPAPPSAADATSGQSGSSAWFLPYSAYPIVYTLKIVLTLAAIGFVWPGYRQFPWRLSPWAFVVGVVGIVLWIGLCKLQLEIVHWLSLDGLTHAGRRSAFNPLVQLADRPALARAFLAVRFFGLVVVVAIVEEFFLRGFVIRYFVRNDWWNVAIGEVNRTAIAVAIVVPVLMHPLATEALAAAAWFGLVTWLSVRTRNIWDCVVAHGVTNLLLGLYVLYTGEWQFL